MAIYFKLGIELFNLIIMLPGHQDVAYVTIRNPDLVYKYYIFYRIVELNRISNPILVPGMIV